MFWKRKGKRKGVDVAGGAGAASSTATVEDTDDGREEAATTEGDSDDTVTDATDTTVGTSPEASPSAKDAEETADTETSGRPAKARKAAKAAKPKGADDAPGAAEAERVEPSEDGATATTADTPEEAEPAGSAGETVGAKGAEEAADTETSGEDDASVADSVDAEESEHAEAGTDGSDDDGIQRVRTEGALRADGAEFETVSNTWIVEVGDGVVVIDPAHDAAAVLDAVGEREIYLVACTNGYNTHVGAAIEVAERDEAPIALHRKELRAWRRVHGAERRPDLEIEGGGSLNVGETEIDILSVPGTSSGSVAYYIAELGAVFSGDTLRRGEPGTVGGGYVDYTGQLASVGEVLLALPPDTRVLPDSGDETTVSAESANFDSWVATR